MSRFPTPPISICPSCGQHNKAVEAMQAELEAVHADLGAAVARNIDLEEQAAALESVRRDATALLFENAGYMQLAASALGRSLAYLDTHPMVGSRAIAAEIRALLDGSAQ